MKVVLARVGGGLLLGGSAVMLVAGALALGGQAVGAGVQGIGGFVVVAGAALVATGAAVLAALGQAPATSRITRIGLASLALGMVAMLASALTSRMEALVIVAVVAQVLVGLPATLLGWLLSAIGLVRQRGRAHVVGRAMVLGLAVLPAVIVLLNLGDTGLRFGALTGPLTAFAFLTLFGSTGGLGFLALSERWSWR